jgi:large subunit ribosomal protein L29|tara:strand:+ start:166 stop:396 length:231 start_codon:yes stop_codon:yes gene_type:complete
LAKPSELRAFSADELRQQLDERKEDLFQLRIQNATHQLEDYAQLASTRKDIARIMTILTETVRAEEDENDYNDDEE